MRWRSLASRPALCRLVTACIRAASLMRSRSPERIDGTATFLSSSAMGMRTRSTILHPGKTASRGTSSAAHSAAGSSGTSYSSSAVFSSPIFARTRPQAPLMSPPRLRSRETSARSTAPVARPKTLLAPLTIRPPASRCQTRRSVQDCSIPRPSPSPSTCLRRQTPAAKCPMASRYNPMKANS